MYADGLPVEVQIFQDRDIIVREVFPEERLAVGWARLYGDRLKQQGWQEVLAGPSRKDITVPPGD
jgi:hypothetical protein